MTHFSSRWKANRVFDQLELTRYHTGLVLFLEEDHYVAEDFLYLLKMMQLKSFELCAKCNIMSLGTYLKTFNYYTYNNNHKKVSRFLTLISQSKFILHSRNYYCLCESFCLIRWRVSIGARTKRINKNDTVINFLMCVSFLFSQKNQPKFISFLCYQNCLLNKMQEKALFGSFYGSNSYHSKKTHNSDSNGANLRANRIETTTEKLTWAFQAVPTLYSVYQKVELKILFSLFSSSSIDCLFFIY